VFGLVWFVSYVDRVVSLSHPSLGFGLLLHSSLSPPFQREVLIRRLKSNIYKVLEHRSSTTDGAAIQTPVHVVFRWSWKGEKIESYRVSVR
jgi:hypothetical protein